MYVHWEKSTSNGETSIAIGGNVRLLPCPPQSDAAKAGSSFTVHRTHKHTTYTQPTTSRSAREPVVRCGSIYEAGVKPVQRGARRERERNYLNFTRIRSTEGKLLKHAVSWVVSEGELQRAGLSVKAVGAFYHEQQAKPSGENSLSENDVLI